MSKKVKEEEPNEITEMYRELHKKAQAKKVIIRTQRTNTLLGSIFELQEAGIEVFELTPYQIRLIQGAKRIDYYPTSGKYCDLNKNKWGRCASHQILTLFQ
jgi:hypothetical protein